MAQVLSLKNTTKEFLIIFSGTNTEDEFFSETVSGSFVLFSFYLRQRQHDVVDMTKTSLSLKTWICDHRLICG